MINYLSKDVSLPTILEAGETASKMFHFDRLRLSGHITKFCITFMCF